MLTYDMDKRGEHSLYEHLYQCIRTDIERGTIAPDEKLPSKRALAAHLGISVMTVESAYLQLVAEGYLRAVARSGFYANRIDAPSPRGNSRTPEAPARKNEGPFASQPSLLFPVADFTGATVAQGLFPYGAWAKAVRNVLTEESEQSLRSQAQATGALRLRQCLAAHLRKFRGMDVSPDRIVVGAGAQYLDMLIVQLLGAQAHYAVENPGYARLARLYESCGAQAFPVPLDECGLSVRKLESTPANVVHLMPSHQYPTGQVMPIARRYEVLGWANAAAGRYVIEDDYDCEFRLSGRPIPSLQSIDATGRVIYTNTFAKTLGPAFRLAYMVLPEPLTQPFREKLGFYSCSAPVVDQLALALLMEQGEYERHLNRVRSHHQDIRGAIARAIESCPCADRLRMENGNGGLHFILHANTTASEQSIQQHAQERGVGIVPLSGFYAGGLHDARHYDGARFFMSYEGVLPGNASRAIEAIAEALLAAEASS